MGKHGGSESLGALVSEVEAGDTHAILHVGDFAYDFDSDGGVVSNVLVETFLCKLNSCKTFSQGMNFC